MTGGGKRSMKSLSAKIVDFMNQCQVGEGFLVSKTETENKRGPAVPVYELTKKQNKEGRWGAKRSFGVRPVSKGWVVFRKV